MADDRCRRMRLPRLGARSPAPPGTLRPDVRWVRQGGGTGQLIRGRGRGRGFRGAAAAAILPGGSASVTAGRTPGVTDQDLRRSEAWLGNRRRLAGVIRAAVAGLPPQAHRRGRGRGWHLARTRRGAGGRVVQRPPPRGVGSCGCGPRWLVVRGGCGCGGGW
jgi:hypothetical protein